MTSSVAPLIYSYHSESFIFMGEDIADVSPLEEGVYLLPAYATFVPPTKVEGTVSVYVPETDSWINVDPESVLPQQEIVEEDVSNKKASSEIWARAHRDILLRESDWTQGRDMTAAFSKRWAPYRQALRDVPSQSGFPENVIWPDKPE